MYKYRLSFCFVMVLCVCTLPPNPWSLLVHTDKRVTRGVAFGLLSLDSLLVHLVSSTNCKQSHVIVSYSKHVKLFCYLCVIILHIDT